VKIDAKATSASRQRHANGVLELHRLFRPGPWATNQADSSGRWLTKLDRHTRSMIRDAKDKQNPSRILARRRRKIARASRRRNRS
jgi:hypothetical protein